MRYAFILLLQFSDYLFNNQIKYRKYLPYSKRKCQNKSKMKQRCYSNLLLRKSRAAAFISMVIALYVLGDDAMIISAHSLAFSLSFLSR